MLIRTVRWHVTRNTYRQIAAAMRVVSLSLLVIASSWGQDPNTVSGTYRAYTTATATISTGQVASKLRVELERRGLTAEVVADSASRRVFVSGSADAQAFVRQFMQSLQSTTTRPVAQLQESKLKAYPLPDGNLSSTVTALRQKFGSQGKVRIGMDQRTRQILVHAPSDVQDQVQAWLSQRAEVDKTSNTAQKTNDTNDTTNSLTWSGDGTRRAQAQLKHISWQQLVAAVEHMTPNRLTLTQADNSHDLLVMLPARKGQTELRITPASGKFSLSGNEAVVRGWLQAIETIDQPTRSDAEATQLMPVRNVKPETITRTARLLQAARQGELQSQIRWGGDVVGIESNAEDAPRPSGFVELKEAQTTQLAQADDAQPDQQPADDQVEAQVPVPGQAADEGALIGPVQIDFVEGLDSIIIRGSKPDVERVMQIIEDIEKMSEETEPKIVLVPLEYVNSTSMAEMVTQVNTTVLAARRGTVSITALVKPNALLLIGREESVDATIKLIKDLDQPVAPTSQFKVFRLEHMSATDAQLTIDNFFAERGGLGPVIQVQADFRSNALIVYASPRDMTEVQQLISQIDVGDTQAVDEVRVFKLKNALAEELAPVLQAILRGQAALTGAGGFGGQGQFGGGGAFQPQAQLGGAGAGQNQAAMRGMSSPRSTMLTLTVDDEGNRVLKSGILTNVQVAADTRANSLLVTAPPDSMNLIAALVKQLDELPTEEATIKVFPILHGDAPSLAEMLSNLFGEAGQGQQDGLALQSATGAGESSLVPLRFSVDLRTNSIIATGAPADIQVVEAILLRLDLDDVSQRRSQVFRLQNAPALEVATAINELLRVERELQQVAPEQISPFEQIEREVVVVPEVVSNSLIISATPRYFEQVLDIVKELDEQPPMVLIQVLIAEVDLGYADEVGVELGVQDSLLFDRSVAITQAVTGGDVLSPGFNFNNFTLGNANSPESLATREKTAGQALTNFALSRTNDMFGYGGLVLSASSESVNLLIRALRENRRLDILSRPQVMTLNNQPAYILVGQRVPYVTDLQVLTGGQTLTSTTFQNVGLVLGVTPRISPEGLVVMEIDAEKSSLAPESEGVLLTVSEFGPVRQPPIDTTVAQTTVSARSGQTVILGGLITKDTESISRRVPYLADIPLIGDFFRYDSQSDLRTELLIIMTPYIVRTEEDSDRLNQIESERMSWCLADVIDIHGNAQMATQLSSGGVNRRGLTEVIYPDLDPTGSTILESIEEVPMPSDLQPPDPERAPPKSSDKSSRRLTSRMSHFLLPKSKKSSDDSVSASELIPVTAPKQQSQGDSDRRYQDSSILDDSDAAEPPTPDALDISPASYIPNKPKKESGWTKLRKKLTFRR